MNSQDQIRILNMAERSETMARQCRLAGMLVEAVEFESRAANARRALELA